MKYTKNVWGVTNCQSNSMPIRLDIFAGLKFERSEKNSLGLLMMGMLKRAKFDASALPPSF